jgi:Ca2+-binding RTX toxin-like protein
MSTIPWSSLQAPSPTRAWTTPTFSWEIWETTSSSACAAATPLVGGPGRDILIGGLEAGTTSPKSDIVFGDEGNDINIWAGGDGSDAFMGGPGRDALVMANVDRNGIEPILGEPVPGFPNGLPSANATNQAGFCTLERVPDGDRFGYAFLVRFFSKLAGNALLATVRVDTDVEQVFCTSRDAASITFADLTEPDPQFVEVSLDDVDQLNHTVAQIIRYFTNPRSIEKEKR